MARITASKLETAARRKRSCCITSPIARREAGDSAPAPRHHLALDIGTDEALAEQKNLYDELGYTDCSEIKDRFYFHSIYVRSPAGILTECAATAEGGFLKDESYEELGTHLLLPPWFEHERAKIVAMLEPIVVPEANRPKAGAKSSGGAEARRPGGGSQASPMSRRTDATFIEADA